MGRRSMLRSPAPDSYIKLDPVRFVGLNTSLGHKLMILQVVDGMYMKTTIAALRLGTKGSETKLKTRLRSAGRPVNLNQFRTTSPEIGRGKDLNVVYLMIVSLREILKRLVPISETSPSVSEIRVH